jgi:hypothetical protein
MKYILGFALKFKKYKNSMKIRIYSDSHMIDELDLDSPIDAKDRTPMEQETYREVCYGKKPLSQMTDEEMEQGLPSSKPGFPEKLFLYEIDENVINDRIRFLIHDRNTNYTNGFMTNSNQIYFDYVFLIPKNKIKASFFYDITKSKLIDVNSSGSIWEFPSWAWPGGMQLIDTKSENKYPVLKHWHGGDCEFYIPVIKKFNMYMLDAYRDIRTEKKRYVIDRRFLKYMSVYKLLNIYDED